jgi:valyl-tRNA synthetase
MPFLSEEIYSILYKKYIDSESIHLEHFPEPYEGISEDKIHSGNLGIKVIRELRNSKSQMKMPLNQELGKVLILSDDKMAQKLEKIKEDIIKTIRIESFEISAQEPKESTIGEPTLKKDLEDENLILYIFK